MRSVSGGKGAYGRRWPEGKRFLPSWNLGHSDAVGDTLVTQEKVNMISFTGSTPVGKRISQMAVMKRLHLELGGKAYAMVLEDADLDLAAVRCVAGSLKFSGQRCDAVSVVLVV
jgi:glyceraldehyde-3-phosphate dehydrogenase (NADP+)